MFDERATFDTIEYENYDGMAVWIDEGNQSCPTDNVFFELPNTTASLTQTCTHKLEKSNDETAVNMCKQ